MLLLRTSPSFAPEKSYACTVLLEELLGIPCKVELQPDLEHYHLQLPNGAELILEDHFWGKIPGEQYLSEDNIPGAVLRLKHPFNAGEDIIALYGRAHLVISDRQISCGADLFASAFFLLTRWEEAVLPQRDEYGRFPASAALAWREHFLDRPLVNEYAGLLYQMLVHLGWNQPPKSTALRLQALPRCGPSAALVVGDRPATHPGRQCFSAKKRTGSRLVDAKTPIPATGSLRYF